MGIQELTLTRDLMREAGPNHFNMDSWFAFKIDMQRVTVDLRNVRQDHALRLADCGTSACFAGFGKLAAVMNQQLIPVSLFQDTESAVAAWLGVPERIFYTSSWYAVEEGEAVEEGSPYREWFDSPDFAFISQVWEKRRSEVDSKRYDRSEDRITAMKRAEYHTVMDYISWKIVAMSELESEALV